MFVATCKPMPAKLDGQVKVQFAPARVMLTWAPPFTTVLTEALLLPFNGSKTEELTVATFVIVPPTVGATTMLNELVKPLPKLLVKPSITSIVPAMLVTYPGEVTETKLTPVGRVSVTTMPVAVAGPRLVTTMV